MSDPKALVYYVSAHGYGHGVRSCDILRAFHRTHPDIPIHVVSRLPATFLHHRLETEAVTLRSAAFDVGMVQLDSIRVDLPATLVRVEALHALWDDLVEQEVDFLEETRAGLVMVDIPAIPLEAAASIGLPCAAVGNFAWDWIYRPFAHEDRAWNAAVKAFAQGYGKADLLLKLPFSEPMKAFPHHVELPLVAEPGQEQREKLVQVTGADPEKRWVLLSFTDLEWSKPALERVKALDHVEFFTVHPLRWEGPNLRAVHREEVSFPDVVASVDAVVSKPGFGLLSECIVNQKPLLYADRENFIEYPILVEAVERYLQNAHIPAGKLYAGLLDEYLEKLWEAPPPAEEMERNGAAIAVEQMANLLGV